ncbi:phosphoribosylglycinamide formyltransferase [Nocardia sp. NPDC059239]|uniref:phosphoribosylglycinamide formyltransferase n=1 Tax=unclassified Nocardia TaxID=2637762 RepID=UPI0036982151
MAKLRVGVLASHTGSNLRALHQASLAPDADFVVAVVISNNSGSGALAYARDHSVPTRHLSGRTHPDPEALDDAIRATLIGQGVDYVVTAGYMRKLGPVVRKDFSGRIINIHPSLLPRHGGHGMYGLAVHEAVLAAADTVSGPSVHLVDEEYDTGAVLAQREVSVLPGDTVESLAARVLDAEHVLLPQVVARIAAEHHQ